jgi:flagellar biosynthesis/type III secretory pathway protein FliH
MIPLEQLSLYLDLMGEIPLKGNKIRQEYHQALFFYEATKALFEKIYTDGAIQGFKEGYEKGRQDQEAHYSKLN